MKENVKVRYDPKIYKSMPYPWNLSYNYFNGMLHGLVIGLVLFFSKLDFWLYMASMAILLVALYKIRREADAQNQKLFI